MKYDLAVIGNDEAAFEMMFVAAASRQKTVAVLPESRHSSWMMGQALRRLVGNLLVDQSHRRRSMMASAGTPRLLQRLLAQSIVEEVTEHTEALRNCGVDVLYGETRFRSKGELVVTDGMSCSQSVIQASSVVIGTGIRYTSQHRSLGLVSTQRPESLFEGRRLPKSLCFVGGGPLGAGLAGLFQLFGVRTQLIAREDSDCAVLEMARTAGVEIAGHPADVGLTLDGISRRNRREFIDCRRVLGFTEHLNLKAVGIEPDENGQLWCTTGFETWCSGVFGIGAVVGFSSDSAIHPTLQAERVLNRIQHRIPRPHFLRMPLRVSATI
jgi:NAD(P) transhydrogenase